MKSLALIFGLLIVGAAAPAQQYVTSTIAGYPDLAGETGDGGPAVVAELSGPLCMTVDSKGNIYFVDYGNNIIREISTATGIINTIAGTGVQGFSGDGGPAIQAQFGSIHGLAVDKKDNLYISDTTNARVRMINTSGIISTIAGTGTPGGTGNFGPALSAELVSPAGLALDSSGNLYIADFGSSTVREVTTAGTILPVAGIDAPGFNVFNGDGGLAYGATLGFPIGVAVDPAGNIYISDIGSSSIRKIGLDGIINTIVSEVSAASLITDSVGNLYWADYRLAVINKLAPGSNTPFPFAGNQIQGYAGNGGPASYAEFDAPYAVALDSSGNFYVSDFGNDVIRSLVPPPTGTVLVVNGASNIGYGPGGGVLPLDRGDVVSSRRRPLALTRPLVLMPAGANNSALPIAPGELVTLFGADGLGSSGGLQAGPDANGFIETQLGPTFVTFNGIPGPILVSSNNQISAIVPYELAGASQAKIVVLNNGQITGTATVPVAASAPGIFTLDSSACTGSGYTGGPVLNVDGTQNAVGNAAAEASNVTIYETGDGQTSPAGVDGLIIPGPTLPAPLLPVTVMINNEVAAIVSVSEVQGEVSGVLTIVATIPSNVATNNAIPVTVQVGTAVSQTITIAVQ